MADFLGRNILILHGDIFSRSASGRPEGRKKQSEVEEGFILQAKNCSITLTTYFFVPVSVEEILDSFGNLVEEFSPTQTA